MSAKQVRFAQGGQDREEWFGAANLLLEVFEGMRQRMADRETQRTQPESVQEDMHLMSHAHGAVLEIAVVETQPRVDEDPLNALLHRLLNLSREVIVHPADRVG